MQQVLRYRSSDGKVGYLSGFQANHKIRQRRHDADLQLFAMAAARGLSGHAAHPGNARQEPPDRCALLALRAGDVRRRGHLLTGGADGRHHRLADRSIGAPALP